MITRIERLNKYYVSKSDIQVILNLSHAKATELFEIANKEELAEQRFKAHDTKVELKRVLKIAGVDYNFLLKQIKNELA